MSVTGSTRTEDRSQQVLSAATISSRSREQIGRKPKQPTKAATSSLSSAQAGILEDLAAGGRLTVNTGGGSNFLHVGDRSRDVREPTLGRLRKLRAIQQVERQYPILTFGISKRGEELLEQYRAAAKKKREKGESDR